MEQPVQHHCLPRPAHSCPQCGEMIPPPTFCETCGADVSSVHVCMPRPLPHICPPAPPPGRCLACGEPLPVRRFCTTCGEEITPSHRCKATLSITVPRPDPLHICPALEIQRCQQCGQIMPPLRFCERCGMDITPPHVCLPPPQTHVCPPYLTMPRRCSHCGELLPKPRHCTQCGADITPKHVCK
jgi:rRNA maturation endonuclease Nob1